MWPSPPFSPLLRKKDECFLWRTLLSWQSKESEVLFWVAWRSSAAVGYRAIGEWGQEANFRFGCGTSKFCLVFLRCCSVSSYARAGYEGQQLLLLLVFCVRRIYYFDCLGLAVFVVPALGNGLVFILEIFVTISTYGLSIIYYCFIYQLNVQY
jgi:hypothetical protein